MGLFCYYTCIMPLVLAFLFILLIFVIVYFRPKPWLFIADRKLLRFARAYRLPDKKYPTGIGRIEASLVLAYADRLEPLHRISGDGWAAGVYQVGFRKNTVFVRTLAFNAPHLYFDNKANNRLFRRDIPVFISRAQLVSYDGYIQDKFRLYAPVDYHIDALVVGAPDLLDVIDQHNLGADIELLGNQLYFIYPKGIFLGDTLPELIKASQIIADAADDNLSRYHDKHPGNTRGTLSHRGRRIVRK